MKRISKNFGMFAAITAVLLVTALAACMNPNDPTDVLGLGGFELPPGMGAVRVNIGNPQARTFLPAETAFTVYDLAFYRVTTGSRGALATSTGSRGVSELSVPFILPVGDYSLDVIGRTAIGIAATGTTVGASAPQTEDVFAISSSGPPVNVVVNLNIPNIEDTFHGTSFVGNGRFDFSYTPDPITLTVSTPTMSISRVGVGTLPPTDTAFPSPVSPTFTGSSGTQDLPAGFYYTDFSAQVDSNPLSIRRVLHIRQGLISGGNYTVSEDQILASGSTGGFSFGPPTNFPTATTFNFTYDSGSGSFDSTTPGATVDITLGNAETIVLTNAGDFTSVIWSIDGVHITTNDLDIDAAGTVGGTGPVIFAEEKTYFVTVIGITATGASDTFFFIKVEP